MRNRNINEKNIMDLLSKNLYCYLFGTCETAKAHNGIIMDNVPGAIIELGLHQYTKPANPYLSYSVAELQSIVQQFMSLPEYKSLIGDGEKKTRKGWIDWANSIHQVDRVAVQLPGRSEDTTIDLMTTFMDDVVGGVVANYKSFSKKQREELGIDGLAKSKSVEEEHDDEEGIELSADEKIVVKKVISEKPRTLMEFYNIVLYLVALENIENINVAKTSLLSEKIGSYLSVPMVLLDDITSGLELNEPGVSFYKFFTGLFLEKPVLDSDQKANLDKKISMLINEYYEHRDVKRELRRIVQDNEKVKVVIGEIIASKIDEKMEQESNDSLITLFQMTINDDNREKYVKFLKSLSPQEKLVSSTSGIGPSGPPYGSDDDSEDDDSDDDDSDDDDSDKNIEEEPKFGPALAPEEKMEIEINELKSV
jgi:hypothetical protein